MFSFNQYLLFTFIPIILTILILKYYTNYHLRRKNLPPGPTPLPIIGSLHLLGPLPHRSLHKLSQTHGPIMSIRLGTVPTLVLSSPKAAKLVLGDHDIHVSSRRKGLLTQYFGYEAKGLVGTEYGPRWRAIKKLCTMELLSAARVAGSADIRREEMRLAIEEIKECAGRKEVVDLGELVGRFMANATFKMLCGRKDYVGFEFIEIVKEASEVAGAFNLADYVPVLAPFDLQGLTRRIKTISKSFDDMLESIIADHEQDTQIRIHAPDMMDFTDILLSVSSKYSKTSGDISDMIDKESMKAILVDLIVGSIDATITSIEWVLSTIIRYPRVMKKLQQELKEVVGDKKFVDERDLTKLHYLDMVIKETFRLYPTAPLLVPRESISDLQVDGYHIPMKTQIIVNYWAFGRDSKVWSENWEEFLPERFLDKDIELRGQHFELIPFGSGRRGCAGMNLGLVITGLVASNFFHSFNWDLPNGMSPGDLDMSEKFGLSMPRAKPLLAIPTYRL